jgi:hypothetical protein
VLWLNFMVVKVGLSGDRCQDEFAMRDTSDVVVGGDPFGDP